MRVLVAEKLAAQGVDLLRANHEVDVRVGMSREQFLTVLPRYDALLVRSAVQADADAIAALGIFGDGSTSPEEELLPSNPAEWLASLGTSEEETPAEE